MGGMGIDGTLDKSPSDRQQRWYGKGGAQMDPVSVSADDAAAPCNPSSLWEGSPKIPSVLMRPSIEGWSLGAQTPSRRVRDLFEGCPSFEGQEASSKSILFNPPSSPVEKSVGLLESVNKLPSAAAAAALWSSRNEPCESIDVSKGSSKSSDDSCEVNKFRDFRATIVTPRMRKMEKWKRIF